VPGPYFFFGAFGTFAPDFRASLNPIAMACFRLVTFFPLRPDFSVPFSIAFISRSTLLPAALPYFVDDFFFADFFVAAFFVLFFVAAMMLILPSLVRKPKRAQGLPPPNLGCANCI
jgi:hypothetical protein